MPRTLQDQPVAPRRHHGRRELLGLAATVAVSSLGISGTSAASGNGAADEPRPIRGSFDTRQIRAGDLDVGYFETGPADGPAVILLHGWPYDIHSFAEVSPALALLGFRVVIPHIRGWGSTRFLASTTPRNGDPVALATDVVDLMEALGIKTAILAGFDWGARTGDIVAALWPERCRALVSVSGYLISSPEAGRNPLPPKAELGWWYQFYLATERGRAGYERYRTEFARLIWQLASPAWRFGDDEFARSARSFENPDHVDIVVHNYRWRMGLASGEARFEAPRRRLSTLPTISVPTITMEGDANGAPHPESASYAGKFTGPYEHRLITGGIGHNLPQEAPRDFVRAVVDASRLGRA